MSLRTPQGPSSYCPYPASIHLGIVKFKVPNEASSHTVIDAITNTTEPSRSPSAHPTHQHSNNEERIQETEVEVQPQAHPYFPGPSAASPFPRP